MRAVVVAIVATYRRQVELARLLNSLSVAGESLHAIVVVDNDSDPQVRTITEQSPVRASYLPSASNLGCGGGLRTGEQCALKEFPNLTHIWIVDDDTVLTSGALETLLSAMEEERAAAAHPLVLAADGMLGWFPGLLDAAKFRVIRQRQTPEQFVARCGDGSIPFSWSQGIALLVARQVFDEIGFHRDDYWVRGEDLEFTLRITHRYRGIYVPRARVHHLPPEATGDEDLETEYQKHRAMLHNLAYTSLRLRHGHPLIRTLPGNWVRFLRTWRLRPRTIVDAFLSFFNGAIRARPAGHR